ncbi:MAG: excinuclease ABC subunit UvrA [Betaproteobacteria bacterium]
MNQISIRGARTHNLGNVDLDIPRDRLVVITGLSGSVKSSLAFDTLYAEGQRRYVESLSAYARQFLELMEKPDVDLIEGLSPAIAIEQTSGSHNPRSTVGTVTEINDYLRLLWARAGTPHCPDHPDQALAANSVSQMVDAALGPPEGSRLVILAPLPPERLSDPAACLADLQAQGFVRVRFNGRIIEIADAQVAAGSGATTSLEVVIDRLKASAAIRQRLADSFETALGVSGGRAILLEAEQGRETVFSSRFACPKCARQSPELEPRLFSFNNPAGACPRCNGLGEVEFIDPTRVVEFPNLSLASGAIRGWDRRNAFAFATLEGLAAALGFDLDAPFEHLPESAREIVLFGSGSRPIAFDYGTEPGKTARREHPFEGIIPNLERRRRDTDSNQVRDELGRYVSFCPCPECGGSRLRAAARHVRLGPPGAQHPLFEVSGWTLARALQWFAGLELEGSRARIAERVIREIRNRLRFLNDVGLGYLSLDRPAETLSGGESQRIRLASQIGSGLTGVMYVLDEPSIGLHQRDNSRLIDTLRRLRDLGNTVIVVEHDEETIRAADHVIDMGPGAGEQGGQVIAQGEPAAIEASERSVTGQYLSGRLGIAVPVRRRAPDGRWVTVRGARAHNLRGIDARFPVGLVTCVTGVSGSGKSSLVNDTLHRAAMQSLQRTPGSGPLCDTVEGLEHFDKVIAVDQSPIGRTPRSNPATYTGLFTPIRELFAESTMARERGYGAGRFSFNVKGGRCEACEGDGLIRVQMHFLPDVYVPCDTCRGSRYNRETLEVRWRGRNIAEVLDMTIAQAHQFFEAIPVLARKLATLMEVGLGYVRLGQSATTLSGGEAQRVKLAEELSRRDTGRTLYILDEPTTGLHFHDVAMLLKVIAQLRERGNSVVIIEHNLDVIKTADWVIDLGPEGGDQGGHIVACGTPEEVAAVTASHTGRYLARVLPSANGRQAA